LPSLFSKSLRRSLRAARARQLRSARRLFRQVLASGAALVSKPKPRPKRAAAARRAPPVARPDRPTPQVLSAAGLARRRFTCAAGTRDYLLHHPARSRRRPRGLVVMLHGCAQEAAAFAASTGMSAKAGAAGLLVAYPIQQRGANAGRCWNWYRPAHQRRDAGEPAILAGLTRALMAEFALQRSQVFLAGLSAGGAMAAVLAASHGDLFDAVAIHSGLPAGRARSAAGALALMRGEGAGSPGARQPAPPAGPPVRMIVFQGSADRTVHPRNALELVAAATPPGADLVRRETTGSAAGRRYSRSRVIAADGTCVVESWLVHDAGHAWSGGAAEAAFSDPRGPDATAAMLRFFLSPRA
jgi:poly(hydroxyalkanoate) depolymerase family esterase